MKKLLTNLLLTLTSSTSVLAGCLFDGGGPDSFGTDIGGSRPGKGGKPTLPIPPIITEPGPDPLPQVPISVIEMRAVAGQYFQGTALTFGVAAWCDGPMMFMGTLNRTFSNAVYLSFYNQTTGETETALIPAGSNLFMVTVNNPVGVWTVRIETADHLQAAEGSFNVQSDLSWSEGFILY